MNKVKLSDLNLIVSNLIDTNKYIVAVSKQSMTTKTSLYYFLDKKSMEIMSTVERLSAYVVDGVITPFLFKDFKGNQIIPPAGLYNKNLHKDKYLEVDVSN